MLQVIAEVFAFLLAVYGAFALVISILNSIRTKAAGENHGMKLVLMLYNQQECIEGVIRNIFAKDLIGRITPGEKLTILDMGSSDETLEVLKKLGNEYEGLLVFGEAEREKIFEYFGNNSGNE